MITIIIIVTFNIAMVMTIQTNKVARGFARKDGFKAVIRACLYLNSLFVVI